VLTLTDLQGLPHGLSLGGNIRGCFQGIYLQNRASVEHNTGTSSAIRDTSLHDNVDTKRTTIARYLQHQQHSSIASQIIACHTRHCLRVSIHTDLCRPTTSTIRRNIKTRSKIDLQNQRIYYKPINIQFPNCYDVNTLS